MMQTKILIGLVAVAISLGAAGLAFTAEQSTSSEKRVSGFTLPDARDQRRVALADFKASRAVVVVFLGTECPVNNAYTRSLAELHRQYSGKGVAFLGINANAQDEAGRVAAHAAKYSVPFPVLKDTGNVVADRFGAARTPEAFVLDPQGTIRYQGRIDDQFGIGYQRARPTRRDLAQALDEVLGGKPVSQARTTVSGCAIGRSAGKAKSGGVTYARQVSRIMQNRCQECHRPNHIAPMALLSYEATAAWAPTIREVLNSGRMPPWHADPSHGRFSNDRRLPDAERETLLSWIEQGCPKGDDRDLPPPRTFVEGWRIGKPDLVIELPRAVNVPASAPEAGIPYMYFTVDPGFKEDRWVERAEARPDATEVVHHIIAFISPPGATGGGGALGMRLLVGTAPGDMPLILEPGMAKKVPAGSKLVFQVHYTANGRAQKDRSSIGLIFARDPPKRQVLTFPIAVRELNIPPGADNHRTESLFSFPEDAHIVSFMPHMHLRGKSFVYEAIFPDGRSQTLLSVPRYDFNWQSTYRLMEPVAAPKGTKVHCVAHFDNSAKNPNNPDPTKTVNWGDQTWEEMMIGWMDFTFDRPAQ